jgi:NAD(P) transhydrogenase subunit beta
MNLNQIIELCYIISAVLFILGLKMLSSATTARKGNFVSAIGMLVAVVATLVQQGMSYQWIIVGSLVGTVIGGVAARSVKMTAMPEMVALFNGFGGLASLLVGWAEFHHNPNTDLLTLISTFFAVLIGGVTFTGSIVAFGKLSEIIPGKPILFKGQQFLNAALLIAAAVIGVLIGMNPSESYHLFIALIVLSLVLGVLAVIGIGGADMPVVIALLNSYSGIAGSAAGFVILNSVLIVSGALVGASGIILTSIMCKAMNRSLTNVLFGGVGASKKKAATFHGEAKPVSVEDAYYLLEAAQSVIIVPGYGMAVAQAQHAVRELGELLQANGAEVRYVIHPVAGRMPGHMNVLLAEANVPYEQLVEPQDVNPIMSTVDVALVIGANDVVNPAARTNPDSPIYGMPIINVDEAKTVIVSKRSLSAGFAGVDNPLFFNENTRMLFGDAKSSIQGLVAELKG